MLKTPPFCKLFLLSGLVLCFSLEQLAAQTPIAYAGADQDYCAGDTLQLQGVGSNAGPNYTYQWSPMTYLSDPSIANPMAWPPNDISYTLVVTSNTLQSAPDTLELRAHAIPTVDAGPDRDNCLGDSAILDGTATGEPSNVYTYTWSPNYWLSDSTLEDPAAMPLQSTTYYFSAVSIWGCASNIDSTEVTVVPTASAEAGPNDIVCVGDSTLLNGTYFWVTPNSLPASQVSALWSPTNQLQSPTSFVTPVMVDSTRWYTLEVTAGQCIAIDSVFIAAIPRPSVTLSQNGNTLTATGGLGGASIQWFKDQQAIPGASSVNFTVGQPGCYAALIFEGGCTSLSDTICFTTVGLQSLRSLRHAEVFPNPFAENISLKLDLLKGEALAFELRNALGQEVLSIPIRRYSSGLHQLNFETGALPKGVYFLHILGENGRKTLPLLH